MILCDICNYWQHSACFGLRNQEEVPELHVCELCANKVWGRDPYMMCRILMIEFRQTLHRSRTIENVWD